MFWAVSFFGQNASNNCGQTMSYQGIGIPVLQNLVVKCRVLPSMIAVSYVISDFRMAISSGAGNCR